MLTTVDPTAALVVVDLQKGVVGLPTVHHMSEVLARNVKLTAAFRDRGFPVVLVTVAGMVPGRTDAARESGPRPTPPPGWDELVPELAGHDTDLHVVKRSRGAFHDTGLAEVLRARGVTQVFVTGVATGTGAESTARQAYDHGFHVVPVVDAMTDVDAEAHRTSVERVFPKLGEVATTAEVLAALP